MNCFPLNSHPKARQKAFIPIQQPLDMKRETVLVGGIVTVLFVAALSLVAVPGVLGQPEIADDVRAGYLSVAEVTITPKHVSGNTATLSVDTSLDHGGGPSENVTVLFRVTSLTTGLVQTTQTRSLGTITGNREASAVGNITVPREGGYRIESIVYQDGRRVATDGKEVRGVGTLQPAYTRTPVKFHRFGTTQSSDLPAIEFSVANTSGNESRLNVSTYLTNTGNQPTNNLRLTLIARQADSNIIADRSDNQIGRIGSGETALPSTTLTVPSEYNYYLDAILWRDGVIVGTTRAAANLAPKRNLSVNTSQSQTGLKVSDFESDMEATASGPDGGPVPGAPDGIAGGAGPGFGLGAAVVTLLSVAVLLRRRTQ